jgi:hypothetical protein
MKGEEQGKQCDGQEKKGEENVGQKEEEKRIRKAKLLCRLCHLIFKSLPFHEN